MSAMTQVSRNPAPGVACAIVAGLVGALWTLLSPGAMADVACSSPSPTGQTVCRSYSGGDPQTTNTAGNESSGSTCGSAETTVTDSEGTRHSNTGGGACPTAPPAATSQPTQPTLARAATAPIAQAEPSPLPSASPTAVPSPVAWPQVVLGGVDKGTAAVEAAPQGSSVTKYVLVALALALGGGGYILFQRRNRLMSYSVGNPAVLAPNGHAGAVVFPEPRNAPEAPTPSSSLESPYAAEPSPLPTVPDRHSVDVNRTFAPSRSNYSPIVELHFVPEQEQENLTDSWMTVGSPVPTEADVGTGPIWR